MAWGIKGQTSTESGLFQAEGISKLLYEQSSFQRKSSLASGRCGGLFDFIKAASGNLSFVILCLHWTLSV